MNEKTKTWLLLVLLLSIIGVIIGYYLKPSFLLAMGLGAFAGGSLLFVLGFILGWLMIDPFQRAKLKRRLTKKNWGIAYIIYKKKYVHPYLFDFSQKVLKIGSRIYHLQDSDVMNQSNDYEDGVDPKNIIYMKNIPVVFLDFDDMIPIDLNKEKIDTPSSLASDLLMWIDAEVYKKVLKNKRVQDIALIVSLILIIVILGGFYFMWQNNQDILKAIHQMSGHTARIITQNITKAVK